MHEILGQALLLAAIFGAPGSVGAATSDHALATRFAFREDLTGHSLALEAFGVAKYATVRTPGHSDAPRRLADCARALAAAGARDEAQAALSTAIQQTFEFDYATGSELEVEIAPAVYAVHGLDGALDFLDEFEFVDYQVDAFALLLAELESEGRIDRARELVRLTDANWLVHGGSTALALAVRHLHALNDADSAARLEQALLGHQDRAGRPLDFWPAVRAVADEHAARGDFAGGERYLSALTAAIGSPHALAEMRKGWLALSDRRLAAGEVESVRISGLGAVDPYLRAEILARVAEAQFAAGSAAAGERDLASAVEAAREGGISALAALGAYLSAHGRKELADELLADAHRRLRAIQLSGQSSVEEVLARDNDAEALCNAYIDCGEFALARLVLREVPAAGDVAPRLMAQQLERATRFGGVETTDALDLLDEQRFESLRAQRLGVAARAFARSPAGERERARFVAALVERARNMKEPLAMSQALAEVVLSGLATPRDPSALHAWSLAPILEGEWTTPAPAAAEAAVEVLRRALAAAELPEPRIRALRTRPLSCYPGEELIEIDGLVNGLPHSYLLHGGAHGLLWLGLNANDLNRRNDERPPDLADDASLIEYVRFFCAALGGSDGRFRVIDDSSAIAPLLRPSAKLPAVELRSPRILRRDAGGALVEVDLLFGTTVLRGPLTVANNGRVSLGDTVTVARDLPIEPEILDEATGGYLRRRASAPATVEGLSVDACLELAREFATGFGAGGWARDDDAALDWLARAGDANVTRGLIEITDAWALGRGVVADAEIAAGWLALAVERGDLDSAARLGRWLAGSNSPGRSARGLDILESAAAAGHADSAYQLGALHMSGAARIEAGFSEARRHYERAVELGSGLAAAQIGLALADARGTERDLDGAARCFRQAGELGSNEGWYFLGILRANGFGDDSLGSELDAYTRAAEGGLHAAQVVLALRLRTGLGRPAGPDRAAALDWSARAAEAGHRFGMLAHALLLAEGSGEERARASELRARAAATAQPTPSLVSFVDPCYLVDQPGGRALDAVQALETWRQAVDAAIGRLLTP